MFKDIATEQHISGTCLEEKVGRHEVRAKGAAPIYYLGAFRGSSCHCYSVMTPKHHPL